MRVFLNLNEVISKIPKKKFELKSISQNKRIIQQWNAELEKVLQY
jgi:hypothetical protein